MNYRILFLVFILPWAVFLFGPPASALTCSEIIDIERPKSKLDSILFMREVCNGYDECISDSRVDPICDPYRQTSELDCYAQGLVGDELQEECSRNACVNEPTCAFVYAKPGGGGGATCEEILKAKEASGGTIDEATCRGFSECKEYGPCQPYLECSLVDLTESQKYDKCLKWAACYSKDECAPYRAQAGEAESQFKDEKNGASQESTPNTPDEKKAKVKKKESVSDILAKITAAKGKFGSKGLGAVVGGIVGMLLSMLGVVFLALLVYAGFQWMSAAGDEKKVGASIGIISRALIGLTIVIAAYAITVYVTNIIQKSVGF